MITALFRPGDSIVHRAPAGFKLAALVGVGTLLFLVDHIAPSAAALTLAVVLFFVAGFGPQTVWRQLKPALWILAILFAAQLLLGDWRMGALLVLRFAALILGASLVTLTTRTADIVAVIEWCLKPLSRVGVDVEKVGLAISLTIRFIPAIAAVVEDVRDAQRARGLDRHMVALAVPVIVRLLKMADTIAEAIDARS